MHWTTHGDQSRAARNNVRRGEIENLCELLEKRIEIDRLTRTPLPGGKADLCDADTVKGSADVATCEATIEKTVQAFGFRQGDAR